MITDPDQIRSEIAARLAELPDVGPDAAELADAEIEAIAAQLEQAHDLLVHALEAVDRGPAAASGSER
ncbi:hypothetical protein [Mycolicibacterium arseniciresistens]|uniref:Uncharacterized protein n=1 Tax=Mycolicibacterium arseniciresistens TaxID=3062257 RepID=A0ABT8UG18_9MYCO|nr:hypothetical protein [Mycolicibacterium arseniciresistens]MDO3636727.1 hypothetical protein [Mycolicibacterium arseniciresistens]